MPDDQMYHSIPFMRMYYAAKYFSMLKFEIQQGVIARKAKSRSNTAANIAVRQAAQTARHPLLDQERKTEMRGESIARRSYSIDAD